VALARSGLRRFSRRGAGEAQAADILATLPTPVLAIDGEGVVCEANVAAEALLNVSRLAVIGRQIGDVIGHPLNSFPIDQPFAAYDLEITMPGGRRARVDLAAAPLPERAGWRSITIHSHRSMHLAGRRTEREGGVMAAVGAAAMLAHEIKNPLSGIRGAAQLLEMGADEDGRAMTTLIRDEVDRIAALIDRMEGFTDTRPLEVGPQNIHAILGHVRDVTRQGFGAGRVLREMYDPSLPAVLGHRDALIQIFMNLVKNAVEATENEPESVITLTTAYRHGMSMGSREQPGRRVMLPIEVCVIDEGPGAPDAVGEHLFDPFVSSKRRGGGLGLALVDKLVGDLGGAVEYRREGTPVRTVFRVLLPRAAR
jgi:two-component system nitrogen regulation sensor histidine kinase GlnL